MWRMEVQCRLTNDLNPFSDLTIYQQLCVLVPNVPDPYKSAEQNRSIQSARLGRDLLSDEYFRVAKQIGGKMYKVPVWF